MYDCLTIMKLLYPYLDGELDVKESLRVQVHLEECPYCLEVFKYEREFLKTLKSSIPVVKAPDDLRGRVSAALAREGASTRRARFWPILKSAEALRRVVAGVGAVFLTGVLAYGLLNRSPGEQIELAVKNHQLPYEATVAEPRVLVQRLGQDLDFPLEIPLEETREMKLRGGRVIHGGQGASAFMNWESDTGGKVSLLVTTPARLGGIGGKKIPFENLEFHLMRYMGYYALAWRDKKLGYVLVSDRKEEIAAACLVCHSGEDARAISEFRRHI